MKNNTFVMGLGVALLILISSSSFAQRGRGGHMGSSYRGFSSSPRMYSGSFSHSYNNFSVGFHNRVYTRPRIGGHYYMTLPSSYVRIRFGGIPYYFVDGLFYNYFDGYYGAVFPPFGITIGSLPLGYWGFNFRGAPYYYYSGIYYQPYKNKYQVVEAPIGATVPQIPSDAKEVFVNNEKYFEYNGTYYKQMVNQDGSMWYVVAGLHGVLNTNSNTYETKPDAVAAAPAPEVTVTTVPSKLKIGDIVPNLPEGCKAVIINNKKYFVTPGHIYYEEYIENNTLMYKVVGN
jgi:hypothetical protein